jgi:site-specific DNA-methyltransferase (adenine-specific)
MKYHRNVAQRSDAFEVLQSLPSDCTPLAFFDPQHRDTLDRLADSNEGARQKGRAQRPAMSSDYIDACGREMARILRPGGYLQVWAETFQLCEADHLRIADVLKCVDLIAWDNHRPSNGYRSRPRGDYLLILQKPPLRAKATWRDHGILSRWSEMVKRDPGDLIIDPAAGSFVVLRAALALGREFIGCDITWFEAEQQRSDRVYVDDRLRREAAE